MTSSFCIGGPSPSSYASRIHPSDPGRGGRKKIHLSRGMMGRSENSRELLIASASARYPNVASVWKAVAALGEVDGAHFGRDRVGAGWMVRTVGLQGERVFVPGPHRYSVGVGCFWMGSGSAEVVKWATFRHIRHIVGQRRHS